MRAGTALTGRLPGRDDFRLAFICEFLHRDVFSLDYPGRCFQKPPKITIWRIFREIERSCSYNFVSS